MIRANDTFFYPSLEWVNVLSFSIIHTRSRAGMYHSRKLLTRGTMSFLFPFFFFYYYFFTSS